MDILKEYAQIEIIIKGSKFLTEAFVVQTQQEARELLKKQKQRYQDATHVVHAFVIGKTAGILGCSDDGEPSGTAGKPALAVLAGANITDIMITITRWFGGTLLGTGGLVKAYGDSVKEILKKTKREKLTKKLNFEFDCNYPEYELIKRHLQEFEAEVKSTKFTEIVKITGTVPEGKNKTLCEFIKESTKGNKVSFNLPSLY